MQPTSERSVVVEVILDILKFPWWWYTAGLVLMLSWCGRILVGYARMFAIDIWVQNLFVPMFGQYDWQSRLISIFMRGVQIVGRSLALMFMAVAIVAVAVAYVLLPILIVGLAIYHLTGSWSYGARI